MKSIIKISAKTFLSSIIILFVLFQYRSCLEEKQLEAKKTSQIEETKATRFNEERLAKLTPEERTKEVFGELMLENYKNSREKNKDINVGWSKDGELYLVDAQVIIQTKITNGHPNNEIFILDTMKLAKTVFRDKNMATIKKIKITANFLGLNRYGNETLDSSCKILLERKEIEKINWENMTSSLFIKFLNENNSIWFNEKY